MMVERNVVELGPYAALLIPEDYSYGIIISGWGSPTMGNAQIVKNTVVCNGEWESGIALVKFPSVGQVGNSLVRLNHITLLGGYAGIVHAGLNNTYIGQNKIDGEGVLGIAVAVECLIFGPADNTILVGNNFCNLDTSGVDVYISECASNTVLVGGRGTLLDLGVNTKIKGGHWDFLAEEHVTTPGGVGPQISGALRNLHESIGLGLH